MRPPWAAARLLRDQRGAAVEQADRQHPAAKNAAEDQEPGAPEEAQRQRHHEHDPHRSQHRRPRIGRRMQARIGEVDGEPGHGAENESSGRRRVAAPARAHHQREPGGEIHDRPGQEQMRRGAGDRVEQLQQPGFREQADADAEGEQPSAPRARRACRSMRMPPRARSAEATLSRLTLHLRTPRHSAHQPSGRTVLLLRHRQLLKSSCLSSIGLPCGVRSQACSQACLVRASVSLLATPFSATSRSSAASQCR